MQYNIHNIFSFIQQNYLLVALFMILFLLIASYDQLFGKIAKSSISISKLVQLMNDNQAFIIDLRSKNNFDKAHINKSINIPSSELTQKKIQNLTIKNKKIILVDNIHQDAFKKTAIFDKLNLKYTVLLHGITGWKQSMPITKTRKIKNKKKN